MNGFQILLSNSSCAATPGGVFRHRHQRRGRAVQVGPLKPTLKAPGTKLLKLKLDKLLSILTQFCFQIQLALLHRGSHRIAGRGGARCGLEQRHGRAVQVASIKHRVESAYRFSA